MAGARPDLGMQATSVRPQRVHRAAAGARIQKLAITTGAPSQREDAVFEVEVLNQPGFAQALGDLLGLFVFGLEGIDQLQAHQIWQFDFNGHGAAVGGAGVTQAVAVPGPRFGAVYVNKTN